MKLAKMAVGVLALAAAPVLAQKSLPTKQAPVSGRRPELSAAFTEVAQLGRTTRGGPIGFGSRDNCPETSMYSQDVFGGGTFTLQAGFAQGEVAAASYTLPASRFPLKFTGMEVIVGQQNATVTTTTEWSVLIWDGLPGAGTLVAEYSSDGTILPHIVMGPGTRATNVQLTVDPSDPDQIFLFGNNASAVNTFSIGFRIDHHNNQVGNPCNTPPPSNSNAFPATDNTSAACGQGYGQLQQPTNNWLFGLNCGSFGCPPNGGWARFSQLAGDFGSLCGCRPHGDWVMRATWDPVNCPGVPGACCIESNGNCLQFDVDTCAAVGGTWMGANTTCADDNSNGRADICEGGPQCPPCVADYNRSGGTPDDADIAAYFTAWNNGDACADANHSGGTPDDADISVFFTLWNAGGC